MGKENSLIIRSNEEIILQISKYDDKIYALKILSYLGVFIMLIGTLGFLLNEKFVWFFFIIMGGFSYLESLIVLNGYSIHQEVWINRIENRNLILNKNGSKKSSKKEK